MSYPNHRFPGLSPLTPHEHAPSPSPPSTYRCGPCKQIAPAFEALAAEHSDVVFIKVDVDELEDIAEQFNVSAMPTFIAVKNKVQVGSAVLGANLDKLKSLVKDNK